MTISRNELADEIEAMARRCDESHPRVTIILLAVVGAIHACAEHELMQVMVDQFSRPEIQRLARDGSRPQN